MTSRRSPPEDFCSDSKRQKTFHHAPDTSHEPPRNASPRSNEKYTVAWICALPIEMTAAEAMLDELHDTLPKLADDNNTYTLGRIHKHNVVIACLPTGCYGTINAATVTSNLKRSFPSIRAGLMVGIGGGVPSKADLRLGDVVVGTRVMQCDMGKIVENGQLQRTAIARIPHQLLGTAVSALRAKQERDSTSITSIVAQKFIGHSGYHRPDLSDDLFPPTYDHEPSNLDCNQCDRTKLVPRRHRSEPAIHYGAIASGNQVMRNALQRDIIGQELDVICFEMEAAGLMDIIPCLPIRGICDYSDSHKNKSWQRYAAATAAAFASGLLAVLPSSEGHESLGFPPRTESGPPDDRCQRLLELLDFDQKDSRQSSIKTAHAKTCRWLLKHADYQAWLDPERLTQHHGFLWIRGKPGAGKSTTMKFAHGNMRGARRRHGTTAAFFFNARGDYIERSVPGMYRSLLLQLLQGIPEVQSVVDSPDFEYRELNNCLQLDQLKELFWSTVLALGQQPFTCFIDALDECDEQQVMDMVRFFEDLAAQTTDKDIKFRICFSNRHYPYIFVPESINLILENQLGHTEDLAAFVGSRLRIQDSALRSQLQDGILQKASGVFLWVSLVVDILNNQHARGGMDLRKRLKEIPGDLNALFKDMLRRDEHNKDGLLLSILWILCAKRPLSTSEFSHALWSGLFIRGQADSEPPSLMSSNNSDIANRFVTGSSKGLAEVAKTKGSRVHFIHESVRDFLLKSGGLKELWPDLGFDWEIQAHERLKECCSLYLGYRPVRELVRDLLNHPSVVSKDNTRIKYPFLEYATHHVLEHAEAAEEAMTQQGFLSQFPVHRWVAIANHFQKHSKLAALLGTTTTKHDGVNIMEGLGRIKNLVGFIGRTPLSWAVQENRIGMVRLLLHNGAEVSEQDRDGHTAYSRALKNGNEDILVLLLSFGAPVRGRIQYDGRSPIMSACDNGHEKVLKYLVGHGVSVSEADDPGHTGLSRACKHGHLRILEFLIGHGLDVNARTTATSQTPMYWAADKAMVRCLLKNGADANVRNIAGRTPLQEMLRRGWTSSARALVEGFPGIDCNTVDDDGVSPLIVATRDCHEGIVRLLIKNGADIRIGRSVDGDNVLQVAVSYGYYSLVDLYIHMGAVADVPNNEGLKAWDLAQLGGKPSVIERLARAASK